MSIKFGLYQTPQPEKYKGKPNIHARVLSTDTKHLEDICKYIGDASSLTPSDIKAALQAFFDYMSMNLRYGSNIELEGLGHFSVALKTQQVTMTSGKRGVKVTIDGVNFRCSKRLKNEISTAKLKKVKVPANPSTSVDTRRKRMIDYLEENGMINRQRYAWLNGCNYYLAGKDLKQFLEEGLIATEGRSTHKVYLLTDTDTPGITSPPDHPSTES